MKRLLALIMLFLLPAFAGCPKHAPNALETPETQGNIASPALGAPDLSENQPEIASPEFQSIPKALRKNQTTQTLASPGVPHPPNKALLPKEPPVSAHPPTGKESPAFLAVAS